MKDLNIVFGKNDSGKSNIVRALNLFFSGSPDHGNDFEFPLDFSEKRKAETDTSDFLRKFVYVKITFFTPENYQRSLGKEFYVKRQWTVSRGSEYHEEISNNIPSNRRHIVTRLLNKIKFIYIPAIKDTRIFEMLLASIYESLASSHPFIDAVDGFSNQIKELTADLFQSLPNEVSNSTKIGAPTQLSQLFQTLDFETQASTEQAPKSLTRQRGDGVKVRHIPELLSFISQNDKYDFHIWGFEEPENSLDFAASQSEAFRFLDLARGARTQIFMTTHSPSFYLLDDKSIEKFYVEKDRTGESSIKQGKELFKVDAETAMGDGFYLPAVAKALEGLAEKERQVKEAEESADALRVALRELMAPVVLTEGRTDATILATAWRKLRGSEPPFSVRSCETGGPNAGSGDGGATTLCNRIKAIAADHPHAVIGLFDYDPEGINGYKLNKNFVEFEINNTKIKRGMHGKVYALCLIPPDFRQDCYRYQNLPIEYMFPDSCLEEEVGGEKLILKRKKMSTKVGEEKIERELDDLTHFKDVSSGKNYFAENVIQTFDAVQFRGFKRLFETIEEILRYDAEI